MVRLRAINFSCGKEFDMWYVMVLVFGIWGDCRAMNDEHMIHLMQRNVSNGETENPDTSNPFLSIAEFWKEPSTIVYANNASHKSGELSRTPSSIKAALIVHYGRRIESLTGVMDKDACEERAKYEQYLNYLQDQPNIPIAALESSQVALQEANRHVVVYGYANGLNLVNMQDKESITKQLKIPKTADTLRLEACSVWFGNRENFEQENFKCTNIFAVDTDHAIHEWLLRPKHDDKYIKWERKVPGTVTAIHQLSGHATALFFKDMKNVARVALAFSRYNFEAQRIDRALKVSALNNVTHVVARSKDCPRVRKIFRVHNDAGEVETYCEVGTVNPGDNESEVGAQLSFLNSSTWGDDGCCGYCGLQ